MAKRDDTDWRQHVLNNVLPRMEANDMGAAGFTPGPANPQPLSFAGAHFGPQDDPLARLPDAAATKMVAIEQRAVDLRSQIPLHEALQEIRLEALGYKNRISELMKAKGEGGPGLSEDAGQVQSERKRLLRAEKELARLTELKEVRSVRWAAAAQLHQATRDWALRGIPGDCTLDVVSDASVAELLRKNETLSDGVERYRLLQRQAAAERHRVNSQVWPISITEAAARELIERLADAGRPNLENAVEHNLPVSFATTRLTSSLYNIDARVAIAYAEMPDAIGLICWLFGQELLEKIRAGFREIGDDENALDERQRAEMLATIDADSLSAERAECSLIWAAAERSEVIDFRSTTLPEAVLDVALRTVPRAAPSGTSIEHGYDIVGPGLRR